MNVAAITRFKQGDVFKAMHKLGWSQKELARRSGLSYGLVCDFLNMKRRPNEESANAIQRALAEENIYIDVTSVWPDSFKGFKKSPKVVQIQDVEPMQLEDLRQRYIFMLEQDTPRPDTLLLEEAIKDMDLRPEDERTLGGVLQGMSYSDIADSEDVTPWAIDCRMRRIAGKLYWKFQDIKTSEKYFGGTKVEAIRKAAKASHERGKEWQKHLETEARRQTMSYEKSQALTALRELAAMRLLNSWPEDQALEEYNSVYDAVDLKTLHAMRLRAIDRFKKEFAVGNEEPMHGSLYNDKRKGPR
jgi:transcriptional regulator with XRE-family HTH domain